MSIDPKGLQELNLPTDYEQLTGEGKKLARIAGVCKQGPTPDDFVRAWVLFRTYYLQQLPPGVFYKEWVPSPPLHYMIVRDMGAYRLNAWACPRGSAKSTILGTEVPLMLVVSRSNFEVLTILAKESMVQRRIGRLMIQLTDNPFIIQDFGELRPPRSTGKLWNHSVIQLQNGSSVVGMPVEGKLLGERPDLILPDDPEHDKAMSQDPNPQYLREAFERLLFGTLFPMLRKGSSLGWIGTLLDARSFLYKFIRSKESYIKDHWNRREIAILNDSGESVWEGRWSNDDIKVLRASMPEEYFQTHFMNKPGASRGGLLKIHPKYCMYDLIPPESVNSLNIFDGGARIVTTKALSREVEVASSMDREVEYTDETSDRLFSDALRKMRRFITVDFGFSMKRDSDYSVILVMGYENSEDFTDTLWVLDLWMGHLPLAKFIPLLWYYATKWKPIAVAGESVAHQVQIVNTIRDYFNQQRDTGAGWCPLVIPLKYPAGLEKEHRISSLSWRFDRFRIKLPKDLELSWPMKELFHQIRGVDSEVGLKALQHDDAVDALAMFQFIGGGRGTTREWGKQDKGVNAVDEIKAGNLFSKEGIPYITMLTPQEMDVAIVKMLQAKGAKSAEEEGDVVWKPA